MAVLVPGDPVPGRADAVLVDADGHARAAYAPADGEFVAVRPDGHIGARGSDATAVAGWLRRLLPPALTPVARQ